MKRIWRAFYWLGLGVLVIPSFALVFTIGFDAVTECELNPYAGFTCPRWMAPLVGMAGFGVLTIVPFMIIALIYAVFAIPMWWANKRARRD